MADETENKPDFDQLVDQVHKGNKQSLQYSRMRFLATWLALALLAILICVTLVASSRNAQTDLEQTDDIARVANTTADDAKQDTDDIVAYMRGEQGIPGVPGTSGVDGSPGLPGESGTGEQGEKGDKGDTGDPGATGPAGTAGSTGSTGPTGPQGAFGAIGPVGPTGAAGEQGPKGEKGDKGDEGARGAEGPTGPMGAQGPQGPAPPFAPPSTVISAGQSANDPNTPKTANATCPSGGRASGGGFAIVPSDPGLIVTASSPVANTGWSVTVEELSFPAADSWQVLAFVTCIVP